MRTSIVNCLVGLVLAGALPAASAAPIGEIFYTEGRVQVKRGVAQVDVGKGYALEAGDVVLTGANSQVRMRLVDQSYFALPAYSTFRIDEFSVSPPGRKRQPGTAIFSLLRGGLRTVSGLVGSWSKDNYQMKTPVVTMGIRGTEYSVIYCNNDCPKGSENGGHLEVLSGTIGATSVVDGDSISLDQGQWGLATNPVRRVLTRPMPFVLDKSGVFDPNRSITGVPGAPNEISVDVQADVRIERPVSPSAPAEEP